MEWLKFNKDAISIVLSTLAFVVSTLTFYRSWWRDKQEAATKLRAKSPRITVRVDSAEDKQLRVPASETFVSGWDYYLHLEIENRFDVSFTVESISGRDRTGAEVRLHTPVGSGLKSHDPNRLRLEGDRSGVHFKPTPSGGTFRPSFYLHLEKDMTIEEVRKGTEVDLTFEFELHDISPKREIVTRRLPLRPGGVIAPRA